MSGVEIVGLLASVTQLVHYSIKITQSLSAIYQDVKDAPKRIKQNLKQIQQLITTAELVEQYRSLQTTHVRYHIEATLLEARALHDILAEVALSYKQRFVRRTLSILKGKKEKIILETFDKLEKEKSALTLCINIVHTDLLCSIQGGVEKLSTRTPFAMSGNSQAPCKVFELEVSTTSVSTVNDDNGQIATREPNLSGNAFQRKSSREDEVPESGLAIPTFLNSKAMNTKASLFADHTANANDCEQPTEKPKDHIHSTTYNVNASYDQMTSAEYARQVNGDVTGASPPVKSRNYSYQRVHATGQSRQVNGNIPDLKGFWDI